MHQLHGGGTEGEQPLARIGERPSDWPRKRALWEAIREVPEDQFYATEANLVDMGYIYDLRTRGNDVRVLMTMPHQGRPKYDFLAKPLRARLESMGVEAAGIFTENGHDYEVAVPLRYIESRQGKDWREIRINVTVDDHDQRGDTLTQLWWQPKWKTAQNYPGSGTFARTLRTYDHDDDH